MKQTFLHLSEDKRQRIISASICEFGDHGYEKSSLDRIIKSAGISKGGLYEYIDSKEELFLFLIDYTFTELYDFIERKLTKGKSVLPPDILERFRIVSSTAIDFYINHPASIAFIVKSSYLPDPKLEQNVASIFNERFLNIFSSIDKTKLQYDSGKLLDLLRWLLLKTRTDFIVKMSENLNARTLKKAYLQEWDFYLEILKNGIYIKERSKKHGTRA